MGRQCQAELALAANRLELRPDASGSGHGNRWLCEILQDVAWAAAHTKPSYCPLQPRLEGQPQNIVAIAWKAQVRQCARFRRLRYRGSNAKKSGCLKFRQRP